MVVHFIRMYLYMNMSMLHMDIQWHDGMYKCCVDAVAATIDFTYQTYISKHHRRHLTARYTNALSIHATKVLKWMLKLSAKAQPQTKWFRLKYSRGRTNRKTNLTFEKLVRPMNKRFLLTFLFLFHLQNLRGTQQQTWRICRGARCIVFYNRMNKLTQPTAAKNFR